MGVKEYCWYPYNPENPNNSNSYNNPNNSNNPVNPITPNNSNNSNNFSSPNHNPMIVGDTATAQALATAGVPMFRDLRGSKIDNEITLDVLSNCSRDVFVFQVHSLSPCFL